MTNENKVYQLGSLARERESVDNPQDYRVYDPRGVSATLRGYPGGHGIPLIVETTRHERE